MSRRNRQDIESSPHPDGLREGVMNDPVGVEHGVYLDNDAIHPEEIAAIRKQSIKTMETNAEDEKKKAP